jgi:diadenosine tetraphosphate (Ap4A) HIT family hydrolase
MTYNLNNIFARMIEGKMPCNKVYEDNSILAFHDIHPQAPIHVLAIPKGPYKDAYSFFHQAPDDLILGFQRGIAVVISKLEIVEKGLRIVANQGVHGGQEVPHYHVHILGGKALGPMIVNS